MLKIKMPSEARETKAKINNWGDIKIRSFCTVKEIVNKSKRQLTEWERVRERETQNVKQAPGSELSAQSPMRGSNSRTVRL